ncbi:DinB family protein [Streptomyces sp. NPDC051561]|uniref:DinB family protein n=1 Tax=Streptomyces sp. NPDC051561 TaxID=3365658 RepID=UPI00378DB50B
MVKHVSSENLRTEADALLAFLDEQRGGIRRALLGLTDEQAATKPSASELSLSGLLKHVTETEQGWIRLAGADIEGIQRTEADWADSFRLVGSETVAGELAHWQRVADTTDAYFRAASLATSFPLPEAPWYPKEDVSLRWVLLRLITEMARHAGHADIIRETLDGKTAFELVDQESGRG